MAPHLRYARDIYAGTANYYDVFRPPYPPGLLNDLRARVPLRPAARVLDLACGTGQVAFAIADYVSEVCALDQEPEFVAFGEEKSRRLGVTNIGWIAATAEDAPLDGAFDLVAIGNAFHRFDRNAVASRLVDHLNPGGCVALLWSESPWRGDRPWQKALDETLTRWQEASDALERVPASWEQAILDDPHKQVLLRAGLQYDGKFEFSVAQNWSVESLIGFVYSSSFLNPAVLGENMSAFEEDLRAQLLACDAEGVHVQKMSFAYELARRVV